MWVIAADTMLSNGRYRPIPYIDGRRPVGQDTAGSRRLAVSFWASSDSIVLTPHTTWLNYWSRAIRYQFRRSAC